MQLPVIQPEESLPVLTGSAAPAAPCCARHEAGSLGWTCPMHPEVVSPTAGTCPICGMALEPIGGNDDHGGDDFRRRLSRTVVPAGVVFAVSMLPMLAGMLPTEGLPPDGWSPSVRLCSLW